MLTYAFDLLYAIYEEEGCVDKDIPGLILANNLYGTEIDPRAGALAAFALTMKARAKQRTFFQKQVEPHICVIEPIWFSSEELDFLLTRSGNRQKGLPTGTGSQRLTRLDRWSSLTPRSLLGWRTKSRCSTTTATC